MGIDKRNFKTARKLKKFEACCSKLDNYVKKTSYSQIFCMFFIRLLPYLATHQRLVRLKGNKDRIESADMKIKAAQSFPKFFIDHNLSILVC